VASPWVLRAAIDDLHREVTRQKLWLYAAAIIALVLVEGVFRYQMRMVLVGISREIEYELRNRLFAHFTRLSSRYYQQSRIGDLMSRATNDMSAVRMVLGPGIMYTATTLATFAGTVSLMCRISPRLLLLALLPLIFVSVLVRYFGRRIHDIFEGVQAQLSTMNAIAQENLAGARVVRAYSQEAQEEVRFETANREYVARNRVLIRMTGFLYPGIQLLMGLGAVTVLWLGGRMVVAKTITLGEFVAFGTYLTMLNWPMIAVGWVVNLFERGEASMGRINELLDAKAEIVDAGSDRRLASDKSTATVQGSSEFSDEPSATAPASSEPFGAPFGSRLGSSDKPDRSPLGSAEPVAASIGSRLEFRGLTFAYSDGRDVLHDIDLVVPAGTTVAIVGPTGSGKSTLVNLIPRLFDPPAGTLLVDGTDARDLPLAKLRGAVGFVPQETFLFSDTLRANVAFGLVDGNVEERTLWASEVAQLAKDVRDFPKGYDTFVGERGITLSGGQKQRTALARALATDPRILILDDALSAVDTHTEEEILRGLREVMKARTTFVVSHRISTVKEADLIVVLRNGRIVERGTHDALVARGGFYADLNRRQLLEKEVETA
jgi:ATP-binding cassette subfamily B multidrug efflux pump